MNSQRIFFALLMIASQVSTLAVSSAISAESDPRSKFGHYSSNVTYSAGNRYDLSFDYPYFWDRTSNADSLVNLAVKTALDDIVDSYISLYHEDEFDRNFELPDWWRPFSFDESDGMKYYNLYQTESFVSFLFQGYFDWGGAHGVTDFYPIIISLKDFQLIAPERFFVQGSSWLEQASQYCYAEFIKRELPDTDWVREGTAPKLENYSNLLLTEEGVLVIFTMYQVGPAVLGWQQVKIPYDVLDDFLNPELFGK